MDEAPKSKRTKEVKKRRGRGEGSVHQRHVASCPPPNKKGVRPDHLCKGPWVVAIDLGYVGKKHVRLTRTGKTKTEALAKKKKLESEIDKGGGLTEDVNVEEWLNHWLKYIVSERNRENTLEGYTSRCTTWLIPYLGKYRLTKLNQDHIRAMYRVMKEQGLSDGTRRRTHAVLHRALVVAMQEGRITRNPAAMMDAPSTKVKHRTPLTLVQARQILDQLDGNPLAARWVANLLQGMRQGECLALTWDDIDFERGKIHIRQSQTRLKNRGLHLTPPKSASSIRTISMTEPMRYALENTERRGEFVFYGEPKDAKQDWLAWKKLLVDTGICPADMAKGDMPELAVGRTTTGTLLRDAGVPDTVIRDILGHSQVQVTQESYQRTDEPTMGTGFKALENLVAPTVKKVTRKALPPDLGTA